MKQTSKDKIVNESILDKLTKAREYKKNKCYQETIEMYGKVIFLKEQSEYLVEMAEVYQDLMDLTTALAFYRRANQLKPKPQTKEKIKQLAKLRGMQLIQMGSLKNILEDTPFQSFIKRYPAFHQKLLKKTTENKPFSLPLYCCLAFLQVSHRQIALSEIQNCSMIEETDADFIVMKGLIYWSMMETVKGYKQFWQAYKVDRKNYEVVLFLQMVNPKVDALYKDAKYDLIQKKFEKCKVNVKNGLDMHPHHTQLLILNAYLHRVNEEYEQALASLQLANKTLQDLSMQEDLRNQISLTYNEMGIYLFKQNKFQEAITLFTEGLSFKPKDWSIYANRGDSYKALNQYNKALEDYVTAYSHQKKNEHLSFRISGIYYTRGITLFNSRNFDLALNQFDEAIKYYAKCSQFHISRARCLIQLNKNREAIQSIEAALRYDPSSTEAQQLLDHHKQSEDKKLKNTRKIIYLSKEKS